MAAALAVGTMTTMTTFAADNYILFLPTTDVISYDYDEAHVSDEYSTEDYVILLYKPGDVVSLKVDTDKKYYIEDALETTTYASYEAAKDGVLNFVMPEEDILFVVKDDEGNTLDASELTNEPEAQTTEATSTEAQTDGQEAQTAATTTGSVKMNEEQGKISVNLLGNIKGKVTMADGSNHDVMPDAPFVTGDHVDIVTITSDGGNWDNPTYTLYKNGEKVTELSDIVINTGGWEGEYKIDLKNAWDISDGAWTLEIIENGYVAPAPETEAAPAETEVPETEATTEPPAGANALLAALGNETEASILETEIEPETQAIQTEAPQEINYSDLFGGTPETEAPSAETTVEATEAPIETEAQPVETSAEETDVPVETEAQTVETEAQAVETEASKPTKENPEFHSGDIDVSVPFNYVPVPDRENVYMILDPEGSVIDFVIKSENEAGETTWESLVPGIVEVPELEDVYMVSKSDGSVVYLKYTRKTNSTYTFVEVDENGNPY